MHALELAVEVVVDLVRDERAERREQLADRKQARAQRRKRRVLAIPEAPARAPHVPVRELLHERRDRAPRARRVVGLEALGHERRRRRRARARPAVELERSRGAVLRGCARKLLGRGVRVQHVEVVGRPELLQEQAHALAHRLRREAVAVPGLLGGEEVPAQRVRAVLV